MTTKDYQKIFHEIKNSVAFVSSSLQLTQTLHPEITEYTHWNHAMEEIGSLKTMLVELSSARLCDNLSLQTISPESFFTELIASSPTLSGESPFHCELKLEANLPDIPADPIRLKCALSNLLKNSYEAMHGFGVAQLLVHRKGSFLQIDVIDSGGGIDPDYLPKLFTPLATTKSSGTGLGLMIAKQIIEAHNGSITVDSRPKDGCTFSILLPCVTA